MKKMNGVWVVLAAMVAVPAFAGSLGGNYVLSAPCELNGQEISANIPAGNVVLTENVPVGDTFTPAHPAIIVQVAGETAAVLALPIGEFTPFQYGPEAVFKGLYSQNGAQFNEIVHQGTDSGGQIEEYLSLVKSASGVTLTFAPNSGPQVTCQFAAQ